MSVGYTVDYYSPGQINVGFFRTLPSMNYGIVIIRAHSTGWRKGDDVTIFTSEHYDSQQHVLEQNFGWLKAGRLEDNNTYYFTIPPPYIRYVMQGRFPGSIIIMMGCTGLANYAMARAFLDKGAKVYVSWDKSVTPGRTDMSTSDLLQALALGRTINDAINSVMALVGSDPLYGSKLSYFPADKGGLTLPTAIKDGPALIAQTFVATPVTKSSSVQIS